MTTTKTLLSGLTLLLLSGLITAIATERIKETEIVPQKTKKDSINCSPALNFIANIPVYSLPTQPIVYTRKNASSLTANSTIIKSFRKGIELMQGLSSSDYRKWENFIKIHGTSTFSTVPIFNTGHNAHGSQFFLAWHRMYLYFFEKIIIKLTNDPGFRIPYWDPVSNRYLPNYITADTYVDGSITKTNPLKNNSREKDYFSKPQLKYFIKSINETLNQSLNYCDFLENIQTQVHTQMHGVIGGTTGELNNLRISPRDPLFFMLHANIDRIWERWISKDNKYPQTNEFLSQFFYFVDENGHTVKMKGSQVLSTADQLGYKYSSPGTVIPGSRTQKNCCPPKQSAARQMVLEKPQVYTAQQPKTKIDLSVGTIPDTDNIINTIQHLNINQQVYLEVDGINVSQMPPSPVYIYLTRANRLNRRPRLSSYVGVLDLSMLSFQEPNTTISARVNIKQVFLALVSSINDLKNLGLILWIEGSKPFSINFSNIKLVIEER
ncbi:MAG: tyrosinase family protein [Chitinophagaceae bacterium]|nr:tyrosinase family protein [Chitinophagaceae bacterium]